jgi:hypothetical protein
VQQPTSITVQFVVCSKIRFATGSNRVPQISGAMVFGPEELTGGSSFLRRSSRRLASDIQTFVTSDAVIIVPRLLCQASVR